MNFNDLTKLINQAARIYRNYERPPYFTYPHASIQPYPNAGRPDAPAGGVLSYYLNRIRDFLYREI
jgi:hypothetical protein